MTKPTISDVDNDDFCAIFANATRVSLGRGEEIAENFYAPENVFSDADPDRVWRGEPTVEFGETRRDRVRYVDGSERDVVSISAIVRSNTRASSRRFAAALRRGVVEKTLERLESAGAIDDFAVVDDGAAPDVRGSVVGETFLGFVDFELRTKRVFR